MSNPTKRGLLAELESLRAMVEELEIVSFAHAANETGVPHLAATRFWWRRAKPPAL